jgi:hypothetical protein
MLRQKGLHYDCATDAAFRATQLKVAITQWLHLHQKEGPCQEENITARIYSLFNIYVMNVWLI